MDEPLNATLITEHGEDYDQPTELSAVSGSLDEAGWQGVLSISPQGLQEGTAPAPENPGPEASLRIDGGERDGHVARIRFVGPGSTVLGVTGFAPLS